MNRRGEVCRSRSETSVTPVQYWLRHSDARQVCDLPLSGQMILTVYDHDGSETREERFASGKSQTCRAEWQSHCSERIGL
jgi:hypothetical protein